MSIATTAAQTTTDSPQKGADTAGDAASRVTETTGAVATAVSEQVSGAASSVAGGASNLGATVTRRVEQHPLTALGVATVAGAALQPALAPQVSKVTHGVRSQVGKTRSRLPIPTSSSVIDEAELARMREAFVPAVSERAKQFAGRDLREYLERRLGSSISNTSLRAGLVASVTERAEGLVENRLPGVLNRNLSGARGLVLLAITGAVLKARAQAKQGEGQALGNIARSVTQGKTLKSVADSLTQTSCEQLQRYLPEYRERYQAG